MSKALAAGSSVLSIAAVMLALWTAAENRSLRQQLEDQRILVPEGDTALAPAGDPAALAADDGPAVPATLPERMAALEARVAAMPEVDPDAPAPLAPLATVPQLPSGGAEAPAPGGATAPAPPAAPDTRSEEEIRAQVKSALDEEMAARERRKKKAASFADFAKELKLNETQQAAMQQDLVHMQTDILELLRTPTTAGHVPLDYLLEAWSDPDREAAARKYKSAVDALKMTKLPGTEQTYQAHIDAMKAAVHDPFKRTLTDEQYQIWKTWQLDPSRISWEESPFHQELTKPVLETKARREAALAQQSAQGDGK